MPNYKRYYTPDSIVFVTIVTAGRIPFLIENIDLLRQSIKDSIYKFQIIAGVVMPDHLHLLIKPENIRDLSKIIFSIKYRFSRNFTGGVGTPPYNKTRKGEKGIWQRRFYDHVIRNENDFYKHLDYIHFNPTKHLNISPKNWKHSSFKKFVNEGFYDIEWCNFEDKHKINDMNLE